MFQRRKTAPCFAEGGARIECIQPQAVQMLHQLRG